MRDAINKDNILRKAEVGREYKKHQLYNMYSDSNYGKQEEDEGTNYLNHLYVDKYMDGKRESYWEDVFWVTEEGSVFVDKGGYQSSSSSKRRSLSTNQIISIIGIVVASVIALLIHFTS